MENIRITKPSCPGLFGGVGFHNSDGMLYPVMEKEHFNQVICKSYRELSPGFCRTFAGFHNWTEKHMDLFAEYYEAMQKWTDTPMYLTVPSCPMHFSDEEIERYCEEVADKLAYLYYEKDVKHIRYYCLCNELSRMRFANLLGDLETFKKYHVGFYRAFQKRNLPIGLLATDATEYEHWDTVYWAIDNMPEITEDCCVHIYERAHDIHDLDFYDFFFEKCDEIVRKSVVNNKRVILGECGIQKTLNQLSFQHGTISDTCRYFNNPDEAAYCGLMLTEMAFAAINAGIYAMAYWTFCDYPDAYSCRYSTQEGYAKEWGEAEQFFTITLNKKYNKWGLTKWDDDGNHDTKPHFYALAPLAKFYGRNTKVLDIECSDPLLRSCAVLKRSNGALTYGIVNRHKEEIEIKLDTSLFNKPVRVYEFDPYNVPENKFGDMQSYSTVLKNDSPVYTLKAESVTYFTTDYIEKDHSVFAENLHTEDGILSWTAITDPNHCYYRVYASSDKDFLPSYENQIGSTVAEHLPVNDEKLYYKVLSVDRSGNV